jgi:hypothetical protein
MKKLNESEFLASIMSRMITRSPEAKEMLASTRYESIGYLLKGKDQAYVIHDSILGDGEGLRRTNVVALRRSGNDWLMQLTGEMEGLPAAFKQKVKGTVAFPDLAAAKVERLGQIVDKNQTLQIVYRVTLTVGEAKISKLGALSVKKDDPDLAQLQKADDPKTVELFRKKIGLPAKPPG